VLGGFPEDEGRPPSDQAAVRARGAGTAVAPEILEKSTIGKFGSMGDALFFLYGEVR